MKNLIFFFSFLFSFSFANAQGMMNDYIKWTYSVEKIDESHANLVFKGSIIEGFHIFSLKHNPADADGTGLVPEFNLKKSPKYKLVGKPFDLGKPIKHVDDLGTSYYFEKKATFKQQIEVLSKEDFTVDFGINFFQLCNADGCVGPFDTEGKVKLSGFTPDENATVTTADTSEAVVTAGDTTSGAKTHMEPIKQDNKKKKEKDSNLVIFIAGFLAGLVALITPCMFPMIPMTVTFFTKQSKTRREGIFKALVYGTSIVLIYVTFGLVFTAAMGPLGLNDLSTNLWMNLIFFSIFVLFAFSFLGAFEIQLPNSWVNKMDKQADRGGYLGIFFMAFTLGLVSFSCTGPIIGTLLVEASTSGSYLTPAVGMTGFSLALAIPFTIFAIFPGWLNSLPQSGGWLNSVKVVLGLAELALALKFLSSVDLAYHWDLLTREWFVAIWFVLFLTMGLYLLWVNGGLETGLGSDSLSVQYASDMHPVGDGSILVFHDLTIGQEYAKKKNLPILLDFTGYACQNCRKTESTVWTNDEIRPLLQKQFVIVSLYVDDRTPLPANEVRVSKLSGNIKTVGNKWADLEMEKYGSFQQPLYVVVDSDGSDLTEAIGYTPDIKAYKAFLTKGISAFKK